MIFSLLCTSRSASTAFNAAISLALQSAAGPSRQADAPANRAAPSGPYVPSLENPRAFAEWLAAGAIEYIPKIIGVLIVLFAAWSLSRWLRHAVIRGLVRAHLEITVAKFFGNASRWAVLGLAVIGCLETFGYRLTSLTALVGAVGLAVGLGLQGSLSNLASGVLLMIFRPFKVGDSIVVGGQSGVVDGIDLFTTNLDTADGRRIIMPNSAIFGATIENTTHHRIRRTQLIITLAPGTDVDRTRAVLKSVVAQVIESAPGAKATPEPLVQLTDLTSGLVWLIAVWADGDRVGEVRERLIERVQQALRTEQLAPARPGMDVRIDQPITAPIAHDQRTGA